MAAMPLLRCGARVLEEDRDAADLDLAGIGRAGAGEHPDQRRLAGAVGADQPVDLAGRQLEADACATPERPGKVFETLRTRIATVDSLVALLADR